MGGDPHAPPVSRQVLMDIRFTQHMVSIPAPFRIDSYPLELPAGEYRIEESNETLVGLSFTASRRLATTIRLIRVKGQSQIAPAHAASPLEIAALLRHAAPQPVEPEAARRADDDGMALHPG